MRPDWNELWLLYADGAELCELSREATSNPKRPKHGTLRNHASREKWSAKRELLRAEKAMQGDRNDRERQEENICLPSHDNDRPNVNDIGLVASDCPDSDYWQHGRNWRRV